MGEDWILVALSPLGGVTVAAGADSLTRGSVRMPAARDAFHIATISTAATVWAASVTDGGILALSMVLALVLILLAEVDRRTMLLPDAVTIPLIAAGLAVTWLWVPDRLPAHASGAAAGFAAFAAVAWAYHKARGRDGLGLGDAKLMAAAGAWLGWMALPGVVVVGACAALVTVLGARLAGRVIDPREPIPFGPFLALAIWISWLHGPITFAW